MDLGYTVTELETLMPISELIEWAAFKEIEGEAHDAAMADARAQSGSGGGGASKRGKFPDGFGPNKGAYVNTKEEAVKLGLVEA